MIYLPHTWDKSLPTFCILSAALTLILLKRHRVFVETFSPKKILQKNNRYSHIVKIEFYIHNLAYVKNEHPVKLN